MVFLQPNQGGPFNRDRVGAVERHLGGREEFAGSGDAMMKEIEERFSLKSDWGCDGVFCRPDLRDGTTFSVEVKDSQPPYGINKQTRTCENKYCDLLRRPWFPYLLTVNKNGIMYNSFFLCTEVRTDWIQERKCWHAHQQPAAMPDPEPAPPAAEEGSRK
eukprot:tig00001628_g9431.t1